MTDQEIRTSYYVSTGKFLAAKYLEFFIEEPDLEVAIKLAKELDCIFLCTKLCDRGFTVCHNEEDDYYDVIFWSNTYVTDEHVSRMRLVLRGIKIAQNVYL